MVVYTTGFKNIYNQIKSGSVTTSQDADKAIGQFKDATHQAESKVTEFATLMDKRMENMAKEANSGCFGSA